MPVVRLSKHTDNFVIIDQTGLNDPHLSLKAKGLLAYLLSKPDDWEVVIKQLSNIGPDGMDAVRSGMRELERAGYAELVEERDEQGRFVDRYWVIYETPTFERQERAQERQNSRKAGSQEKQDTPVHGKVAPKQVRPKSENPTQGNPLLPRTDGTKEGYIPRTEGRYSAAPPHAPSKSASHKRSEREQSVRESKPQSKSKSKTSSQDLLDDQADLVRRAMNAITGRSFRKSKATLKPIKARLREGYSPRDCVRVVLFKTADWLGEDGMEQYLRPSTLFAPSHFEEYLVAAEAWLAKGRPPLRGPDDRRRSSGGGSGREWRSAETVMSGKRFAAERSPDREELQRRLEGSKVVIDLDEDEDEDEWEGGYGR